MVHCCVPGCTNYSSKTENVSYHKIPTDLPLKRAWIARLRRDNLPPLGNSYVCSDHFEKECFEVNLRQQLTGQKCKKKLKRDAVPSQFSFTTSLPPRKTRTSSVNRMKTRTRHEVMDQLLSPSRSNNESDQEGMEVEEGSGCQYVEMEDECSDPNQFETTRDFGTQCSFETRYTITATVGTQTEVFVNSCSSTCTSTSDASVQVEQESSEGIFAHHMHDHTYACAMSPPTEEKDPSVPVHDFINHQIKNTDVSRHGLSDEGDDGTSDDGNADDSDDEYVNPTQDYQSSSDDDLEHEKQLHVQTPVAEDKYLIFGSCLQVLLRHCPSCGEPVVESNWTTSGSLLAVKLTCLKGHDTLWNSQPIMRCTPVGNILIASSILFTGNTFTAIKNFASCLGLKFFSEHVFYRTQDRYLFPVLNERWENDRRALVQELCQQETVNLNGDGRCDSPGHNAKYGTYTLMDDNTGKIVAFSVVQVSEVTSSNAMEKEGFERCLTALEDEGVMVSRISTDRHVSISSTMDKNHSHIKHQFDVWHLAKSVVKKLNKKARLKGYEDLAPWIQYVSNHLWWCAATCEGSVQLLREKWLSVLHHVINKHSWTDGGEVFHECSHPVLTRRQVRKPRWLEPGTTAFNALEDVVQFSRLLKDMAKLTEFCHTGALEVYHSMLLKYCPKREHFSYKGMLARTQLAVIDNNTNVGREQAVISRGENIGAARYRKSFPKTHKRWVVKPVKVKKSYDFLPEMQNKVLQRCDDGTAASEPVGVNLPQNIATVPAPNKEELIQRHRSRFCR